MKLKTPKNKRRLRMTPVRKTIIKAAAFSVACVGITAAYVAINAPTASISVSYMTTSRLPIFAPRPMRQK